MVLINFLWQYGGMVMAILVCGWAISRGGPTERSMAAIILVGWCLSILLQSHSLRGPGIWVELIDWAGLIASAYVSLRSRKLWTVFLTACQLDSVVSHLAAKLIHFDAYPYVVAIGIWGGQAQLLILAIAVVNYRNAEKRRWKSAVSY